MSEPLELSAAQRLIVHHAIPTAIETVPLARAVGRIPATAVRAPAPVPPFRQSSRDGFAVVSGDLASASPATPATLPVVGEVAAGSVPPARLQRGGVLRIMTGAVVPAGADQVIPFEECRRLGQTVVFTAPGAKGRHIRLPGTDIGHRRVIAPAGRPVASELLPLLATAGVAQLAVHQRPRVAILCTGSELLNEPSPCRAGQIVSGNRYLLESLVSRHGGLVTHTDLVADHPGAIARALEQALASPVEMLLTTGGMGPGKYDLVANAFRAVGGAGHYQALKVRPGKATMFGTMDRTMVFGLPGPPPAVFLLFQVLIAPALNALQGSRSPLPRTIRVKLDEEIPVGNQGFLHLKGAVLKEQGLIRIARSCRKREPADAVLLLPSHRCRFRRGETVRAIPLPRD